MVIMQTTGLRALVGMMALLALPLGLAGCAAPPPTPPSSTSQAAQPGLGPRPETLSLSGRRPCDLLTAAETKNLQIDDTAPSIDTDDQSQSPQCLWSTFRALGKPDNGWLVRLGLHKGADDALNATDPLVKLTSVSGFSAVQTHAVGSDGNTDCGFVVDVAPEQNLQVFYSNLAGDYPGISHQVACEQADKVAEMVIANLRTRDGG